LTPARFLWYGEPLCSLFWLARNKGNQEHFTPRQIEELTWCITQCVAFNWHNDFLKLDIEVGVTPLLETLSGD